MPVLFFCLVKKMLTYVLYIVDILFTSLSFDVRSYFSSIREGYYLNLHCVNIIEVSPHNSLFYKFGNFCI